MPTGIYIRTKRRKWIRTPREIRTCICKKRKCNNKFKVKITSTKRYCSRRCSRADQKRKPPSEETRRKIGKGHRGKTWEETYGIEGAKKMRRMCKERKRKLNEGMAGKHHSKETIRKMKESHKRENLSKETLEKMSKAAKKRCQNPEYKEKQLKIMSAGLELRPTKPEKKLRRGLNKLFPGEYKYVGDYNTFIGGKNPDFININAQKKIIELFGNFWHSEKRTGISKKKHSQERINHFAKYGYKTLIIWEEELKNIPKLKKKLIIFNKI